MKMGQRGSALIVIIAIIAFIGIVIADCGAKI